MRAKIGATFLVIISVSLASCVASKSPSTREIMNSLNGRHISDVIRAWGAYDHVVFRWCRREYLHLDKVSTRQ